jgi:hypothetical protein
MEPKDWIKGRVRHTPHVSSITHEPMDGIVHVLQAVIQSIPAIGVPSVGERSIVGLLCDELIRQGTKPVLS